MGILIKESMTLTPLSAIIRLSGRKPEGKEWRVWILDEPAIWETDEGWKVVVPKGFMTDFASIPPIFRWWQTGGVGPQRTASYFHDFLYSSQRVLSRRESDRVFRDVMKIISIDTRKNRVRRNLMYYALRMVGWAAWNSNQKKYKKLGANWRVLSS